MEMKSKLVVLASGTLKDSGKVEKLKSEKGQKIALSTCQLFNLSTKKDVAGELPFAKIVVAKLALPNKMIWRQENKVTREKSDMETRKAEVGNVAVALPCDLKK